MSSLTCYQGSPTRQFGWEKCYSASNNAIFNLPPMMSDGRNYASWQPEAVVNERIQHQEGIRSNWSYRQFLQQNAEQIQQFNTIEYCYATGLDPHYTTDKTPANNVPYTFNGTFDTSAPGVGYCSSNLKSPYLTREQLNARLISPVINPETLIKK